MAKAEESPERVAQLSKKLAKANAAGNADQVWSH